MKNKVLYPIKFTPILKTKIWGGEKLKTLLHKNSTTPHIGESWEVSDVEGDTSIVANGSLKGTSLKTLLKTFKGDLIGEDNYAIFQNKFPLLIKFIDAQKPLSIQLHPNDECAAKRHNSFGKTEMWYVMQADPEAALIVGFNQKITRTEYLNHLSNKTLPSILNSETVTSGDAYFIQSGRIHAIGAGVLLAEIQQTSDITYRVYDWDRVDDQGNARELHNDLAIDAIDFDMPNDFKKNYNKTPNAPQEIVHCPYFKTNYLKVTKPLEKVVTNDSFRIYIAVDGMVEISANDTSVTLNKGETALLPAAIKNYTIQSNNATLLEVSI